jgi:hypothetical protein
MITIKHGRATFTVKPENVETIRGLLATIDKSKGRRGAKLDRPKGIDKHHSAKRDYPVFNPRVMLTSDYVTAYVALNHARLHLAPCDIEPATNRTPDGYDLTFPVCVAEIEGEITLREILADRAAP